MAEIVRVFSSGILAGGTTYNYVQVSDEIVDRVRRVEVACDRHQVPLRASPVHFQDSHPAVTSVLVGVRSVEEVEEAVHMLGWEIDPALWEGLRSKGLLGSEVPVPNMEGAELR